MDRRGNIPGSGRLPRQESLRSYWRHLDETQRHYLRAAEGWIGLGDYASANRELKSIRHALHPDVLKVRWRIYAATRKWKAALGIAESIILFHPADPLGWVYQSSTLHELKRTVEARDNLLQVVDRFPCSATLHYHLACFECQLGRLGEAKKRLQQAFHLDLAVELKSKSLKDPRLQSIWKDIAEM